MQASDAKSATSRDIGTSPRSMESWSFFSVAFSVWLSLSGASAISHVRSRLSGLGFGCRRNFDFVALDHFQHKIGDRPARLDDLALRNGSAVLELALDESPRARGEG